MKLSYIDQKHFPRLHIPHWILQGFRRTTIGIVILGFAFAAGCSNPAGSDLGSQSGTTTIGSYTITYNGGTSESGQAVFVHTGVSGTVELTLTPEGAAEARHSVSFYDWPSGDALQTGSFSVYDMGSVPTGLWAHFQSTSGPTYDSGKGETYESLDGTVNVTAADSDQYVGEFSDVVMDKDGNDATTDDQVIIEGNFDAGTF